MKKFTVGAFGVIFDDEGRVLLCLRNDYPVWNLPGGGMDSGETPEECVIREVNEEVGVDVEIVRMAGVYVKPDKDDVVFSFECKIIAGEPHSTSEAQEVAYFSPHDMPKNTSPKQAERIRDAVAHPTETLLRTQTGPNSKELVEAGKL